jgi:hypothetical protein
MTELMLTLGFLPAFIGSDAAWLIFAAEIAGIGALLAHYA